MNPTDTTTDTTTTPAPAETISPTDYAKWTGLELTEPGPDVDDATVCEAVAEPTRTRWGIQAAPVDSLPLPVVRALYRWDRIVDLAAAVTERARVLAEDTTRDDAARAADTAAIVEGRPAHHIADLRDERAALAAAADDLRRQATVVGDTARESISRAGEGDASPMPALLPHLRQLVGPDVAEYLRDLDALAQQRDAIYQRIGRVAEWWRRAASPGNPKRETIMPAAADLDAEAVEVRFDGVRNPTRVGVPLAALAAAEHTTLADLATTAPTRRRAART